MISRLRVVARHGAWTVLLVGMFALLSPSLAVADGPVDTDAVSNLAACYRENQKLAVTLLIDESKSLVSGPNGSPGADPNDQRVPLAQGVMQAFAALSAASTGPNQGEVQVEAVGFGGSVNERIPWQRLDGQSLPGVKRALERFADYDDEWHTDYATALDSAWNRVNAKAATMGSPEDVCRAVVWFTDGNPSFDYQVHKHPAIRPNWFNYPKTNNFVVSRQSADAAVLQSVNQLCDPRGGLADRFREPTHPTYLLSAVLTGPGSDAKLVDLVTRGPAGQCGSLSAAETGLMLKDDSLGRLIPQMVREIVAPPPFVSDPDPCTASPCIKQFTVDPTTVTANLFIETEPAGKIELIGPDGRSSVALEGSEDESKIAGATVDWGRVTDSVRTVTLSFAEQTAGTTPQQWAVRFSPGSPVRVFELRVSQFAGLGLRYGASTPERWVRGEPGTAAFELLGPDGDPLDVSVLGAFSGTAKVDWGEGAAPRQATAPLVASGDSFTAELTVPDTVRASTVTISADVTATTASGEPIMLRTTGTQVVEAAGLPSMGELRLGNIAADRATPSEDDEQSPVEVRRKPYSIELSGSPTGPGQVCLQPGKQTLNTAGAGIDSSTQPSRMSPEVVVVAAPEVVDDCVTVEKGGTAEFPVLVSIERPADGSLSGTLNVVVSSTAQGDNKVPDATYEVPVSGLVRVAPAVPVFKAATFWLLVLASILLALAIWLGLSWWSARLPGDQLVKGYKVEGVKVRPADASVDGLSPTSDWDFLRYSGSRDASLGALQIHSPVRVLSPQDALVTVPGRVVQGSMGAAGMRHRRAGRIAHQVHGQWAFAAEIPPTSLSLEDQVSGDLYFFIVAPDQGGGREFEPGGLVDRAPGELVAQHSEIVSRLNDIVGAAGGNEDVGDVDEGERTPSTGGIQ